MAHMKDMKKYTVKRSSAGLGLFAVAAFTKGELVIEYTGEVITDEESQRRGGRYLFSLNNEWTIDGKGHHNIARYINHSCKPNCEPQLTADETRVLIYAKRNITPGEELTYNYGTDYFKRIIKPAGCRCSTCQTTR